MYISAWNYSLHSCPLSSLWTVPGKVPGPLLHYVLVWPYFSALIIVWQWAHIGWPAVCSCSRWAHRQLHWTEQILSKQSHPLNAQAFLPKHISNTKCWYKMCFAFSMMRNHTSTLSSWRHRVPSALAPGSIWGYNVIQVAHVTTFHSLPLLQSHFNLGDHEAWSVQNATCRDNITVCPYCLMTLLSHLASRAVRMTQGEDGSRGFCLGLM